jgi:YbbR domain-containing protein
LRVPYSLLHPSAGGESRADSNAHLAIPPELTGRFITRFDIADLAPSRVGIHLVDVKPDSIYVGLDRYRERTLPVNLRITTSFRDGYGQVGNATIAPESVTVGGAASVLSTLTSWPTLRATFEDLRGPVDADLPLLSGSARSLTLSVSTVHVSLNVQQFAEKTLTGVAVEATGIPPNREIIFIPPKIDLVTRGGIKQLASVLPGDFHATVDYRSILADTTGVVDPQVSGPAEIQIVSKRPDHLQYIVRKRL